MRILIIDQVHPSFFELLNEKLPQASLDIEEKITANQISDCIHNYEGLVLRSKIKVDQELIKKASNLKFIARAGAGLDNIDEAAAKAQNILLFNAPEGNRDAVGEHIIGMLLMLFNKLNQANAEVNRMLWLREGNRGLEIKGKTIGLIGYGNNGSATSKKLSGFDCKILAYDKYKSNFGSESVVESSLEEILNQSDIISLHIPLSQETKGMINQSFFNQLKKPIVFINAARGGIVELNALKNALNKGQVLGACLDVLENEDLENLSVEEKHCFDFLVSNPKVLFSPHVAGWTKESYQKISEVLAEKIIQQYAQSN